jgi:hypothetical protein
LDQVKFLERRIRQVIDKIMSTSGGRAIVILQADHGSRSGTWDLTSEVREHMSILSAYYFPDRNYALLRPSMTPVNSFRVVFQQFLGIDIDLLPDRNFYSAPPNPYRFIEVTERLN